MMNETKGYAKVKSRLLQRLLSNPICAVASHWVFQSLFYMDPTERYFKIGLDIGLTIIGALFLHLWFPPWVAWGVGFLIAHTLNFLFNGHVWGVLKHYGLVEQTYEKFVAYTLKFQERAEFIESLESVGIYGSLARSEWSPSSDLDVRLVRRPGSVNALICYAFILSERSRAFIFRFPIDIYLLDSSQALTKMRADETAFTQRAVGN